MDRRETLRNLILGGLAGTGILTGCTPESTTESTADTAGSPPGEGYGRFPAEKKRDAELMAETFFRPGEMATLAVLTDIIIPADERSGSATDAGVPDFIEFMSKDLPELQLPLRGGLAWLDAESRDRFDKTFVEATETERLAIVDEIAYPDPEAEVLDAGTTFFNLMRFLTLTGFYTSREGVKQDLAYAGNVPNQWDGVPEDVLAAHGMTYPEEWQPHFLDIDTRHEVAQWDEDGNLLS
jgi:hypothetical protein